MAVPPSGRRGRGRPFVDARDAPGRRVTDPGRRAPEVRRPRAEVVSGAGVRALVVTNLYPTARRPAYGSFVRDQVEALRALGAEVEVFVFPTGGRNYLRAARTARRRYASGGFDVVHAHFGLCALAARAVPGAPRAVTMH